MRLSRSLCAVVGDVLASTGSHATLEALFLSAGAPGEPPALAHHSKWKDWIFRIGQDPSVDSLVVLGNLIEEFMDLSPKQGAPEFDAWKEKRERVDAALEANGLRYFRFGRVLPQGESQQILPSARSEATPLPTKPSSVDELLEVIVRGLRRAMHPLTHRRRGLSAVVFRK